MKRGLVYLLLSVSVFAGPSITVSSPGYFVSAGEISAQSIYEELTNALPEGVWLAPLQYETYAVVPKKWLKQELIPSVLRLSTLILKERLASDDGAANCNAFTMLFRFSAELSAIENMKKQPAIGAMVVFQDKGFGKLSATKENHSIALVRTEDGWYVVEPQSGAMIALASYPNLLNAKFINFH